MPGWDSIQFSHTRALMPHCHQDLFLLAGDSAQLQSQVQPSPFLCSGQM